MIHTLRGNNGSFAGMGSVQVQPSPVDSVEHQSQSPGASSQHTYAAGVTPARQTELSLPVLLHSTGSLTQLHSVNLTDVASMLVNDPTFVFPVPSRTTRVVPSYRIALDAGQAYDPHADDDHVTTTMKFEPYELLTGVSQDRPEVIMLTNFLPLYESDASSFRSEHAVQAEHAGYHHTQTDAGQYVSAQFNMRSLQSHNAQSLLRSLKGRYPSVKQAMQARSNSVVQAIKDLKGDSGFLLNAIRTLETSKRKLDLRNDAFLVKDPHLVARYISKNFQQQRASAARNRAPFHVGPPVGDLVETLVSMGTRHSFDFHDCMHDLGYSQASVRDVFSSTKVWLQTTYELKQALEHHTLQLLDIDPTHQRRDVSPAGINRPTTKYFGASTSLPALPSVSDLINLPVAGASQAVSLLQAAFASVYQNAYFKSEEARIAALAHLVSREYRYSHGLTLAPVQDALARFYGYEVVPRGNRGLFDAVMGTFGNNISDFPADTGNSLASVAQARPEDGVGVLTFEAKYVEGDTGTLTPGGDYYFDRVLSRASERAFDTSGCDALARLADNQLNRLLVIVDGFNLLMLPSHVDPRRTGSTRTADSNFLGHPVDLVHELTSRMINVTTGRTMSDVTNDRLCAVYARARVDNGLKTILFLYTMNRISRAYGNNVPFLTSNRNNDNTPLVDYLVDRLVTSLESSVPQTRSAVQLVSHNGLDRGVNTASLTPDSIRHALKSGSTTTSIVEQFMSSVIEWYQTRSSAISEGYTRYSGHLDTVVMMMAFDFAIAMVARYGDQQIVGAQTGLTSFSRGQTSFVVSQSSRAHTASINDVLQRLNREGDLTRQMVVTFVHALLVIAESARSTAEYFKGSDVRNKLNDLLRHLQGDVRMLRMLLSEQQVMMLAAHVEDVASACNVERPHRQNEGQAPLREAPVLDGSDVAPEVQRTVMGCFSTSEYVSSAALNKRVLTVGVPLGFTERLRQRVSVQSQKRTTFLQKQNDIFQVVVYKVDMRHTDIVYRPLRFLFEMSRFPVRFGTVRWASMRAQPTMADVVNAVPTFNFEPAPTGRPSLSMVAEYASTAVASQLGVKNVRAAFSGADYSFLTQQQRAQILHNHVLSHMLEVYVKMLTGIDVSEHAFYMVEPPPLFDAATMGQFVQHSLAYVAERTKATSSAVDTGGVLFSTTSNKPKRPTIGLPRPTFGSPAGVAGNVRPEAQFRAPRQQNPPIRTLEQQSEVGSIESSLDALGHRHVTLAADVMRTVSCLANTTTTISGRDAFVRRALLPRKFERVFNVVIDPRDFEIDSKETLATPFGRQALELLIKHGEIVPAEAGAQTNQYGYRAWRSLVGSAVDEGRRPSRGRLFQGAGGFRFKERDKSAGDLIADKYFVTVETLDEGDDT